MLRATLISNSSFGDDYIDLRDALQRFLRRLLFFLEEKYFIFRSVLYYSEKMLDFAVQKGEERYEANALHNMASVESRKKNYDESLALNKRSLARSEEHTSELQSRLHLVCRLLLEKKNPQSTQ